MDSTSPTPPDSLGLTPYRLGKPNLKDAVAAMIRELIFSGRLRAGERIDQREIAAGLGVSKVPVREALITLEREGLIEHVPRHGSFVATLNPSDVRDHYIVYGMVAGHAAEHAAASLDVAALDELESILDELRAATDADQQERLNFAFHRVINHAGSSRRLRVSLENLVKGLPPRFYANNPGWAPIADADHQEILDALRRHDGLAARQAMESHLHRSADFAISSLEKLAFWPAGDS